MSERILLLLMELFAIAGRGSKQDEQARRKMEEDFLSVTLSPAKAKSFLEFYDKCISEFHSESDSEDIKSRERSDRVSAISTDLNEALTQKQKMVVIVRLIEYVFIASVVKESEITFLNSIYHSLRVTEKDFLLLFNFVAFPYEFSGEGALRISNESDPQSGDNRIRCPHLEGEILVAYVHSAGMYFTRFIGEQDIQLNGVSINDQKVHIFTHGAIIRGAQIDPIYYSDIEKAFVEQTESQPINYVAKEITYHFPGNKIGLHEFSLNEHGGRLVGIMGGSGAGKSTLLSILNGSATPSTGSVTINGIDIHKVGSELEGVIGFVSQSDLLMEDLTVFQNLYFNAELCFSTKDDAFIRSRVNEVLKDLGLYEARNLKVGSPLEKIISGGQRKRLNIALELIREPGVLFLDEPTSGLSSSDSEIILDLLKSLALKGKLVFVVIHQPSSQIFKLFDNLILLDKGGYPVYQGNPVDAIIYFKTATHRINPEVSECVCCGNVNPEQIFSILEARHIDDNGFPTSERRYTPEHWNNYYREHREETLAVEEGSNQFKNNYKKPSFLTQLRVFVKRDVLSKINNKQYLLITLLEAPVLAILLATMTLYQEPGSEYTFQSNRNIVAYVFMSVIVMLFLGLMTSAEEILADRKIRQRERFLNLSKLAYLESKVLILLVISAVQSALFVIIGNSILEFKDLYMEYWLMLFAVSLLANAMGLNISSAFKSAVTIYILIPFLIIPQLMLSGLLVKFSELNPALASRSVVPIAGDLMATRWAFEGLTTHLFSKNPYKAPFYELEKQKEKTYYLNVFWMNKMEDALIGYESSSNKDSCISLVQTEFKKIGIEDKWAHIDSIENGRTYEVLQKLKPIYKNQLDKINTRLDNIISEKIRETGNKNIWLDLRSEHFNDRIEELVLNKDGFKSSIFEEYGELHPGLNNIYFDGNPARQIRSHFYAPRKHFLGKYYDTFWVNLLVILIMALGLYVALYFEWLSRFVRWISKFRPYQKH